MKQNYEAIFGAFYETYFDFKCQKMSDAEALARIYYAYLGVQNRGEMDKAVVHIAEGRISLSHSKIFYKAKERIIEVLHSLDLEKLQNETPPDDYRDILERRDIVLDEIVNIEIDYEPIRRWYYYEIEKEVKSFFGQIRNSTENVNLLIEEVFDRFERECKNTKSEDIVVKTTLLELLSKHGMNTNESLVRISAELEKFNINDVGQQLSEYEK